MKRGIAVFLCLAMLGSTATLSGCETYAGTAGVGAGTGALAGGIIGHQRGRALEGAAIGAAIGALVGLVVHDIRVTQARNRQQTVETYGYVPDHGLLLEQERIQVLPPTVSPGQQIMTEIQYALLGAPGGIQVTETRTLMRGDRVISDMSVETHTRQDGTWVSQQEFRLPGDLAPGIYDVVIRVTAGHGVISGRASFTVQ